MIEQKVEEVIQQPQVQPIVNNPIPQVNIPKTIEVSEELVIKYLCNCDKNTKFAITTIWPSVGRHVSIPKHEEAAKALRDVSIMAAGSNVLVLTTDYQHQADNINSYSLYYKCRDLLKEIFDKEFYVIAITQETFNKVVLTFKNMMTSHTLPTNIELKDLYTLDQVEKLEEIDLMKDEKVELGKELFGDMLEVK